MNTPEEEDITLVSMARAGDHSAFMALVEKYKDRIFGRASQFGRDPDEIRDLAQEIFIEIWKGLSGYDQRAPFEHWVSRVATNRCMRFLRRNHRRRNFEILGTGISFQDGNDSNKELVDEEVLRQREGIEAREILSLALQRLPPKDALVITLREVEGRSIAQVARDTGWSEANVKVRCHRARKLLRVILEEIGETYEGLK